MLADSMSSKGTTSTVEPRKAVSPIVALSRSGRRS